MSVSTHTYRSNSNYSRKKSHTQSARPKPTGIVVQDAHGKAQLIFSDQEIADDIIATIPKLHAALSSSRDNQRQSQRWSHLGRNKNVDTFELVPTQDGTDDLDLAYGLLAKTELKCHMNEVLNVLISHESNEYETTMRALMGRKFRSGNVLFQQRCNFTGGMRDSFTTTASGKADTQLGQSVLLSVNMGTLRLKRRLKLHNKHRRTQKLCFSSCTHQYGTKDRAVHVMKTLPKHIHDQIAASPHRTSLRNEINHIAVGFDIQSTHRPGGSINQTTQIVAHGYASVTAPQFFYQQHSSKVYSPWELLKRRQTMMNPEAKHVINLLTKSLREFERVIRRRRFGFQSFIYFPSFIEDESIIRACIVCNKTFSMFRRDFFCQLCGQMTCKECSRLYEVEARIGEIRQNRACVQCVVRVDSCVFEDQDIVAALGPVVIDDDADWLEEDSPPSETETFVSDTTEMSSVDSLQEQLHSDEPATRSDALQLLAQIVGSSNITKNQQLHQHHKATKDLAEKIHQDIDNHLSQSLRIARREMRPENYVVADLERDYSLTFDPSRTRSPDHPMPPIPTKHKEAKRLQYIKKSGVLDASYDRSALNLLAKVAAQRMKCPIGYVSMVSEDTFHAIGTYPVRPAGNEAPRVDNMCAHTIYVDKPLIVKNPQRDMRFTNMPIIKDAKVKFYAGFPVRAPDGQIVATLCASDFKPHNNISAKEYATMETLAKLASQLVAPQCI